MVARGSRLRVWEGKEEAGKDCVRRWGKVIDDKGTNWKASFGVIQPMCNCKITH